MAQTVPFTFGVPLLPRSAAASWEVVEDLLGLTLGSLLAQTDSRFDVLIVGHDRPRCAGTDSRFEFVAADWPPAAPAPDNRDAGRKRDLINRIVQERGGGLLMMLDADDWIDTRLVETSRRCIRPEHAGGLIHSGLATDIRTLRTAPLPDRNSFDGEFFRLCGSCAVMNCRTDSRDPLQREPFKVLCDHYRWPEAAEENGLRITRLDVQANYLINTSANHSELHGPYSDWRRRYTEAVNCHGRPLDQATAGRFGLALEQVEQVSRAVIARIGTSPSLPRAAPAGSRSRWGQAERPSKSPS